MNPLFCPFTNLFYISADTFVVSGYSLLIMKYFTFLLLSCSLSLSTYGQYSGTATEGARLLYQEAKEAQQMGQMGRAKQLLRLTIAEDGNFVNPLDDLGSVYREQGVMDSAIFFFQRSLELNPRGVVAHQNLAAVYQLEGQYQAAIDQYRTLLSYHRSYPEAYYGTALAYYNLEQYDACIKYAESALGLYMAASQSLNAADARMLAGQGYMYSGDYKHAIKYFKASKKHFEDRPYYHYYIGFCYLGMGNDKSAREYIDKAAIMGYRVPQHIRNRLNG